MKGIYIRCHRGITSKIGYKNINNSFSILDLVSSRESTNKVDDITQVSSISIKARSSIRNYFTKLYLFIYNKKGYLGRI